MDQEAKHHTHVEVSAPAPWRLQNPFQILPLVFEALDGLCPSYLSDVQQSSHNSFKVMCVSICALILGNALENEIKQCIISCNLKKMYKTIIFARYRNEEGECRANSCRCYYLFYFFAILGGTVICKEEIQWFSFRIVTVLQSWFMSLMY